MEDVMELCLCESSKLVLKPDKLYRFVVDRECSDCLAMEKVYQCKEEPSLEE